MLDYEPIVKRWFLGRGYQITKIPETNEGSPDFLIVDDTSTYLLELKTKFPSDEEIGERKKLLSIGEIHNIDELITRKNGLSKIIRKAKNQLGKYKKGGDKILRLVWLLSTGHLAEPRLYQFETTLYGLAYLQSAERYGGCYFFYDSDFFRYREVLDEAIVSTQSEGKLLINSLSPRYSQMKNSSLLKHFREASVVDPINLEKEGRAFLVDSDVDRADEEGVLQYLKGKYNSDKIVIDTMHYLSGTIDS
jgi:hypothetical protein